jgi:hypothetical protein
MTNHYTHSHIRDSQFRNNLQICSFYLVCDFGLSQVKPKEKNLRDRDVAKGTPL